MNVNKLITGAVAAVVGLIGVLIIFFNFVERVPEGKVAVVYTPSGGASEVLVPGWHLIGFLEKTQQYPTRITIVEDKLAVTTNDGKKLTMPASYEMKVDAGKVLNIFKELGSQDVEAIQEGYLHKQLFQSARTTVSAYSVLDIYGSKISEASASVTEKMAKETEKLGFIVTDVILGTPEVDDATQAAIDSRVQAAQQLEKLNLDKQIATAEAERKKIEAKGTADSEIEKARGIAESNKLLEKSITPELIKMKEAEARLKHGWITVNGAGTVVVDETK